MLATACSFVAPGLSAQTASGKSAAATKRPATRRHIAPQSTEIQSHEAEKSISDSQPDTQALLAQEQSAVASGDPERIELTSTRLIASALRHYGDLRILENHYEEGTKNYEDALQFQEDLPTRLKLGIAYLRLKRKDDAIREAGRVIASQADNAEAWKLKGNALADAEDYGQAAQALAHALKLQVTYFRVDQAFEETKQ